MDTLTFLSSPAAPGSKIWTPGPDGKPVCADYSQPVGPFTVQRAPVSSLPSLLGMLTLCPFDAFLIRGKPIGDAQSIPYRRTKAHGSEPPTLEAEAHRVIPVDWDGKDAAPMRDLEAAARAVRAQLPSPYAQAECIAQATSSAGVKPGMRVRLWFYADRLVSDLEAKATFDGVGCVDLGIYQPHQPVYVATPRFQGMPDPLSARWLLLEGEPLVLPTPESAAALAGAQTASRALQGLGASTIPGQVYQAGGRNQAMTSLAGSMRARGMDADAIQAGLSAHNRTHCSPPLPDDEIGNIARSVANYEPTAVPVVAKVSSVQAEKALRKQLDRLKHDPGLLSDAAAHLKQHIIDGTLTETEIQSRIYKAVKQVHTGVTIIDALRAAPVIANTRGHAEWQLNLKMNAEGGITPGPENQARVFELHPDVSLWYDTRAERPIWERCPWGASPRPYNADFDGEHARRWLENSVGWLVAPRDPHLTIQAVARTRSADPFALWLESLVWDGTQRLTQVAAGILDAHDPAEANVFAWWLLSAVARTFTPGCQVDHVIVLEGPQGIGKTSFLRALAMHPRYYDRVASTGDLNNPRVVAKLQGPVIIELAELAALTKRAAEATKEFLDATVDKWTPMYGRDQRESPRKIVFAGTTNADDYLNDITGSRRMWPIKCGNIRLDLLQPHVTQLWAEAVAAFRSGAKWWPTPEESAELQLPGRVEERRAREYGEDEVAAFLSRDWRTEKATTPGPVPGDWQLKDGLVQELTLQWLAMHIGCNALEKAHALGRTLRALGWQKCVVRRGVPAVNIKIWRRK